MSKTLPEFRFSYNWNNLLCCKIFSTIRLQEPHFKEGDSVNILLRQKGIWKCIGKAIVLHIFPDFKILDNLGLLPCNTGYNVEMSLKLYTQFNSNIPITNDTKAWYFILTWEINPPIKEDF